MTVKAKLLRKQAKLDAKINRILSLNKLNGKNNLKSLTMTLSSKLNQFKKEPFLLYTESSFRYLKSKKGYSESCKFLKFANSPNKPFEHLTFKDIESVEFLFG